MKLLCFGPVLCSDKKREKRTQVAPVAYADVVTFQTHFMPLLHLCLRKNRVHRCCHLGEFIQLLNSEREEAQASAAGSVHMSTIKCMVRK